ncbi:hypothetical protein MOK15_18395 [Sphingobium sp. BYY-5]|nr:hypothetical protein [Sphingobium sp. BYY-5]
MGGNISAEGAKLDLEWMERVGIGGVHAFSGGKLPTPAVVKPLHPFMSSEWQDIFRRSVAQAHDAGFEFGIAGSPGWSETGGPWVTAADGMKKYVWSETIIKGGAPFKGRLALPPNVTGPFQEVREGRTDLHSYGDAAVIAFPTPPAERDMPAATWNHVAAGERSIVVPPSSATASLKLPPEGKNGLLLEASYPRPVKLGALTIGMRENALAVLEVERSRGQWLRVASARIDAVGDRFIHPAPQGTMGFEPVVAQHFRLRLTPVEATPRSALGQYLPKPTFEAFTITRLALLSGGRVNGFEAKAGFQSTISDDAALPVAVALRDAVSRDKIVVLTDRLRPDGSLDWTPPAGSWTILRIGWSLTGAVNAPAEPSATGLEVDKLDPDAVARYLDHYLQLYDRASGGRIGANGVQSMLTDSWEAGVQNWTPRMLIEFRTRRGYDPAPFLPVLTGRVVGSGALSEAFLFDFRKTLKEMVADNHHAVLARMLRARGMVYYSEAQGDFPRAIADGMALKAQADIPTAEYWYRPFATAPGQPPLRADLKESASVAHVYGKKLAAAEALTVAAINDPWAFSPAMLRPVADRIFASGINRLLLHESHHQPLVDAKPGLSLFIFGQYFNRNDTWAEQAGPWVKYLSRTSYMLQQGRPIADIAYFYGEERSLSEQYLDRLETDIPAGLDYDYVDPEALLNLLSVRDGRIVTPSGMEYRLLYVPEHIKRYTLPTLRKIEQLVKEGAVVVAHRPIGGLGVLSPDGEVDRIADRLWGSRKRRSAETASGRVYPTIAEALLSRPIVRDVRFKDFETDKNLLWLHRRDGDTDIYFLSNQDEVPKDLWISFRVEGRVPEMWKADTGTTEPLSFRKTPEGIETHVRLNGQESGFVVFRRSTNAASWLAPEPIEIPLSDVKGMWQLYFEQGRGAPAIASFDLLKSWTESADPGIKYFSGSARYVKDIHVEPSWFRPGRRIELDLGRVHEMATIRLNGVAFQPLWHRPYRQDVSQALKPGNNRLEITTVNLWPNRLIGDKQPGAKPIAFAPSSPYRAGSPLLPSGLLGPVRLIAVDKPAGR